MEQTPEESPQPSESSNSIDLTYGSSLSNSSQSTGRSPLPDSLNSLDSSESLDLSITDPSDLSSSSNVSVSSNVAVSSDSHLSDTQEPWSREIRIEISRPAEVHDSSPQMHLNRSRSLSPHHEYLIRIGANEVRNEDDIIFRIHHQKIEMIIPSSTVTNNQSCGNERSPIEIISQEQIDRDLQCSICLLHFIINEEVKKLFCGHFFHEECILPWLIISSTCPVCRYVLPPRNT